jgi:hypothetical protein
MHLPWPARTYERTCSDCGTTWQVFAAIAGIRATMLVGAVPIAATMIVLAWRHRHTSTNP